MFNDKKKDRFVGILELTLFVELLLDFTNLFIQLTKLQGSKARVEMKCVGGQKEQNLSIMPLVDLAFPTSIRKI